MRVAAWIRGYPPVNTPDGPGDWEVECVPGEDAPDDSPEWKPLYDKQPEPVPMLLWCPECGDRHIDVGEFETKVHHTHACQSCGMVWRPAVVPTVGVTWLPGFKNDI